LIEAFLSRFSQELGKPLQRVSPEAKKILLEYPWPGNVRELQSMLRKALLNMTGPILMPEFLPEELRAPEPGKSGGNHSPVGTDAHGRDLGLFLDQRMAANSENIYAEAVEFMERHVVTRVLQTTGGNQSKAAKMLGITRGSLRNKTHALGIKIDQVVTPGEHEETQEDQAQEQE
jgi:two-component system nitrogen regulation response regulator GlnG